MANGISNLGQALDQITRLKTQQRTMDQLATQLNTGKKTQNLSGLGGDVLISTRTRANIRSLDVYVSNITNTDRRLNMMSNSLEYIRQEADKVLTAMSLAMEKGEYQSMDTLRGQAEDVYQFVLDLLNTQDGDRYLFSGGDTTTKPVNDVGLLDSFLGEFVPDSTNLTNPPLVTSGIIGQWGDGTITTTQFISSYRNMNDATLGYSSALSSGTAGQITTRISDTSEVDYTVLANSSPLKDILAVMGMLKSMPPPEHAPGALNDPLATTLEEDTGSFPPAAKQNNFFEVISDLGSMLNDAIHTLETDSIRLAQIQERLNTVKLDHTEAINTLETIVSDVENVDTTEVVARINQLQVQLEASYQVTALVANLSLVNFLTR